MCRVQLRHLLYEASGGVVIAGGIMPRLTRVLPLEGLRTRFEAKGRYRPWLAGVPLDLMASPWAALRGAATAYIGSAPRERPDAAA